MCLQIAQIPVTITIKYIINPFEQYEDWMGLDDRLKHDKEVRNLLNTYKNSNTKKKRKSIEKKLISEITLGGMQKDNN